MCLIWSTVFYTRNRSTVVPKRQTKKKDETRGTRFEVIQKGETPKYTSTRRELECLIYKFIVHFVANDFLCRQFVFVVWLDDVSLQGTTQSCLRIYLPFIRKYHIIQYICVYTQYVYIPPNELYETVLIHPAHNRPFPRDWWTMILEVWHGKVTQCVYTHIYSYYTRQSISYDTTLNIFYVEQYTPRPLYFFFKSLIFLT